MVTCGIHILKTATAQVLDGARQHWHRPAGWELQRVERSSRIKAKVGNWAEMLISSFLCEVLLAHLTPNLGRKYTVCHIGLQRLLTPLIKHWRTCQLKSPLSRPFAIWLLQLLLSQLFFSIAFSSNLETEPVPVPAVLSKLDGWFFGVFLMLLRRTACWWLIFSDNCWLFSCRFQFTGWGKITLINSGNS